MRVSQPDPRFASLLMEQFGGANGELTAALQYFIQAFVLREKNPKAGNNWTGAFIDANGDPTVDLRNNLAAESRAKVVCEYLKQFTDDPGVQETLTFLMTREVAHYQQFTAALNDLPVNFPPGTLAGDERFQNVAFNMSNGKGSVRGPWNQGQGPWPEGTEWQYVEEPTTEWLGSTLRQNMGAKTNPEGSPAVPSDKPFTHEQRMPTA